MYTDILHHVLDAVSSKDPEKWRTNSFLLHYNAPAHQSVLIKDFLANQNVTTQEHPSYSPDLDPADFHTLP